MLTIEFHNQGIDHTGISDYNYEVRVNDRIIETGRIEQHKRSNGWRQLVATLVIPNTCCSIDAKPKGVREKAAEIQRATVDAHLGSVGE